jgi:periplasmic divalent cation tolerance protein
MQGNAAARSEYVMCVISGPEDRSVDIARAAVERGLAACAQVTEGVTSFYRWDGEVQEDREALIFLKTKAASVRGIEELLAEMHPYEVPELIAIPIEYGFSAYLKWIEENVKGSKS